MENTVVAKWDWWNQIRSLFCSRKYKIKKKSDGFSLSLITFSKGKGYVYSCIYLLFYSFVFAGDHAKCYVQIWEKFSCLTGQSAAKSREALYWTRLCRLIMFEFEWPNLACEGEDLTRWLSPSMEVLVLGGLPLFSEVCAVMSVPLADVVLCSCQPSVQFRRRLTVSWWTEVSRRYRCAWGHTWTAVLPWRDGSKQTHEWRRSYTQVGISHLPAVCSIELCLRQLRMLRAVLWVSASVCQVLRYWHVATEGLSRCKQKNFRI